MRAHAEMMGTSLHTLVQMVDNGLGVTMIPQMALHAGILNNTGVIAREERYLERKFGDAYRAYKARVRRWV